MNTTVMVSMVVPGISETTLAHQGVAPSTQQNSTAAGDVDQAPLDGTGVRGAVAVGPLLALGELVDARDGQAGPLGDLGEVERLAQFEYGALPDGLGLGERCWCPARGAAALSKGTAP
ncbi:hypothetical protein ACW4TU_45475 (plasmid) [Streptomyces sp. QTS52]